MQHVVHQNQEELQTSENYQPQYQHPNLQGGVNMVNAIKSVAITTIASALFAA